ncbi:MAG: thrombospondin type 3 repeat-containing protein, partial [Myxococcota bacterium]|nr:thrombospondin type 3 repeat-containing protein [Myxococcota bacterium]
ENTEATCADGLDNDGDNYIDCDDWDCDSFLPCKEATNEQCSDLQDNDNDDDIDCDDIDCQENATICGGGTTSETSVAACADGTDNDSDGDIDCADSDCASLTICDTIIETTIEALRNPDHTDYDALEDNEQRLVRLSGVVVTSPLLQGSNELYRFFVQEAFPPADTRFHGIEVFASDQTPEIQPGDTITLDGLYDDYFGRLSIVYQGHTLTSSGTAVTTTSVESQNLATAEQAKPYEGVLIELTSVKITSNEEPLDPEENGWSEGDFWVVESSLSTSAVPLAVKVEYAAPSSNAADTTFGYLKGYLSMVWNIYRLFPRDASDYGAASATSDDDDSDGLSNAEEALLGTNAAVADTDGDGDNDLAEVVDVSVPADSDCDGKIDAIESSLDDGDGDSINDQSDSDDNDGANADPDGDGTPNSSDDDDDGDGLCDPGIGADIADVCTASGDNCPTTANADQANVDSDALGDVCDADIDGDDYCNPSACGIVAEQCAEANDNCPSVDNADQTDTDADGAGNACDGDDDNDGVDDGDDNCVLVPNGDQANTDGDINGNACDTDDDDDGIADGDDNCPLVSNGTQEDTDDDGVGDACEVSAATPLVGELMINELLADPYPSGGEGYHKCHYLPLPEEEDVLDGDVNCDGVRDTNQDEFVEFVNISGKTLDLTGCTINISDDAEPEFEFTEDSADPSKYIIDDKTAVVIFGGGDPVVSNFAGAKVFASSTEWFLTNSSNGAQVTLTCSDGSGGTTDITSAGYGSNFSDPVIQAGNIDQSLTRATDADGSTALVKHEEATGVISYCVDDTNTPCNASCTCIPAAYSPGTCINGVRFPDCLN